MPEDWLASPRWLDSPRHIVTAAVVVCNAQDEILLIESPRWEIPGGQVELQESIRDAAVREVREESGVLVELLAFRGISQNVPKGICNFLFTAKPVGGVLSPSEESTRVGWFALPTALELIARPTMRKRVELALSPNTAPFLVELLAL